MSVQHDTQIAPRPDCDAPLLTIFSVLKPFVGQADEHQRNALASWRALGDHVQIVLFSDSIVPDDIRRQFRCEACDVVNEFGTPLLDQVFRRAAWIGDGKVRAFVNADIVLDHRFRQSAANLLDSPLQSWLAIGQRTKYDMPTGFDRDDDEWIAKCFDVLDREGTPASIVCKDYFLFTSDLFQEIPAFAIGRGNWDNWMVSHCKNEGIPVVDITEVAPVIHQRHGYHHVNGGRMSAYVRGPEARRNQELAGGRHLVYGSTANWKLESSGIRKAPRSWIAFGRDCRRFSGLLYRIARDRVSRGSE